MPATFRVRVEKDELVFSAAHFITLQGNVCERLHGHNYRVAAEVSGPLGEHHYVIDFLALRDALRNIVAELDHHVLLPTEHPQIRVETHAKQVDVAFFDRRWAFPRGDCVLLPVANTTAERLAQYIGGRLLEALDARSLARPTSIRLEVEECLGAWGIWEMADPKQMPPPSETK